VTVALLSKYNVLKGGWFDIYFRLPSFLSPTIDLPGLSICVSVTVIDKVGLDKMRVVNCIFLPSAKFDVKK